MQWRIATPESRLQSKIWWSGTRIPGKTSRSVPSEIGSKSSVFAWIAILEKWSAGSRKMLKNPEILGFFNREKS